MFHLFLVSRLGNILYVMPFELRNNLMMIPERWEMGQTKVDPYISYGESFF